jgi:hypothetical protein
LALQEKLGTSYKDASHRLYVAAWEKLKSQQKSHAYFDNMAQRTDNSLAVFRQRMDMLSQNLVGKLQGPAAESNAGTTSKVLPTGNQTPAAAGHITSPYISSKLSCNAKGKQKA